MFLYVIRKVDKSVFNDDSEVSADFMADLNVCTKRSAIPLVAVM